MANMMLTPRNTDLGFAPFEDFFRTFFEPRAARKPFMPVQVDIKDEGDAFLMEADMPGVSRDKIAIDVENDVLTLSAHMDESKEEKQENYICRERRVGSFRRSFSLEGIDKENITAQYTDGVLTLRLPKVTEHPKTAQRIEIQ